MYAFEYFDQFTRWFPIRVRIAPTTGNMWAADMLVSYLFLILLSLLSRSSSLMTRMTQT
jgi:hypothetical protein